MGPCGTLLAFITNVHPLQNFKSMFPIPARMHLFASALAPITRRRQWHPTPVLLPGKSHGRDTTERLHFHFLLSCIGEGNGNPLRCSYLENPRDGGAWWAAVYGISQSLTRLKRLSSSSSSTTPWTVTHQALLSMEFSRLEYCSGLPFPPPGHMESGS